MFLSRGADNMIVRKLRKKVLLAMPISPAQVPLCITQCSHKRPNSRLHLAFSHTCYGTNFESASQSYIATSFNRRILLSMETSETPGSASTTIIVHRHTNATGPESRGLCPPYFLSRGAGPPSPPPLVLTPLRQVHMQCCESFRQLC